MLKAGPADLAVAGNKMASVAGTTGCGGVGVDCGAEAAGCGAAVLTEFRPTVPELFDIGQEVLAFHDFDELVDQAGRLLNESGLGQSLGDAASRRAHRDHSYDLRVATILEKVS